MAWLLLYKIRLGVRSLREYYALVAEDHEQDRNVGHLNDSPVEFDKLSEGHDVSQRAKSPADDVRGRDIAEQSIGLDPK